MPVMVPPIVFIRHGETDWNVELRLQGQHDIPMNARGREQALRNGRVAAKAFPDAASYDFVCSPLGRSRETMEIVRKAMGLDPLAYRLDDRLIEIGFGAWEGLTLEELQVTDPARVAARHADKWGFQPPGGESYRALAERVAGWLASLTGPTFAVAHGGVGRVLYGMFLGIASPEIVSMDFHQDRILVLEDGHADWI